MDEPFILLLSALQAELQEYGALLHVFDRQQACIVRHNPAGFLDLNPEVEAQLGKLTLRRIEREEISRATALQLGRAEDSTLAELAPECPATRRPLLRALIDEISDLACRTQRRTQQNCTLLAQCLESAREILSAANAEAMPGTYSRQGEISLRIPSRNQPTRA